MDSSSDIERPLPRRLGRYILLSRLHEGGMTEVYAARLAEEVGPGRLLVIKILPQSSKDNPEAEARFLEEARIILNITHGNITAAFEFGREQGRPFLVMEYVPGPSLRRLLDYANKAGHLLKIQDSLFVVREVCRALSYAHSFSSPGNNSSQGIIHRDISPGNILISTAGQVKLTDFGIARFVHSGLFGPVWGKAAYIAPEVAAGSPPSPGSDLYSLGAVLYECLTGIPPIRGENDKETLKLILSSAPEPPSEFRSDLPKELDLLLLRLLSKKPDERPPSASAIEVEIRSMLADKHFSYTEPALAETVLQYFPSDDYLDPFPSDHLRAEMLRAGVELNGGETTDDLVAVHTVPLAVSVKPQEAEPKNKRLLIFGAAVLVALAVVGVLLFGSKQQEPTLPIAINTDNTSPNKGEKSTLTDRASPSELSSPGKGKNETQAKRPSLSKNDNRALPNKFKRSRKTEKQKTAGESNKPSKDSKETEWGWLNLNSYPWSYVTVDGQKLNGHTPLRRVKLSSGRHTLVFENPKLGLKVIKKVDVKAWEETNIGVKLE